MNVDVSLYLLTTPLSGLGSHAAPLTAAISSDGMQEEGSELISHIVL